MQNDWRYRRTQETQDGQGEEWIPDHESSRDSDFDDGESREHCTSERSGCWRHSHSVRYNLLSYNPLTSMLILNLIICRVFIVMDFIEHDLKTLLSNMPTPFLASEIKTLLLQLIGAMATCHDNWIIHRDLKTSNLLMNNRGQIKVADFGLARTYGDPMGDMTQLVVTLWYR